MTFSPSSRRRHILFLAVLAMGEATLLLSAPLTVGGQEGSRPAAGGAHVVQEAQEAGRARVAVEENVRRVPNGQVLGRLGPGAPLRVFGRDGEWLEVEMEGWVWMRSLQVTDREGLDLVVAQEGGENLRAEPSGAILGRLDRGTLLKEVERRPGWVHVLRRAWIWGPSVTVEEPEGAAVQAGPVPAGAPGAAGLAGSPTATAPPAGPGTREPAGLFEVGEGGGALLAAPDGDTLALVLGGTQLPSVTRRGSWVRVRVEGWMWDPFPVSEGEANADSAVSSVLGPEAVKSEPDRYRGRVVAWVLQYISLERAERVRTDFYDGEPFLLARFGDEHGPFVYVAVPPERMSEVEGLVPLEYITVTGRIRTGASALTGTPILDLISLDRSGTDR
ncbi:MAG: SH3 domain-containing protein [Gemmatimonadota bacterium]